MDFKLVLPGIYINFDIQTKFEVNQTQIGHSMPLVSFWSFFGLYIKVNVNNFDKRIH